MIKNSSAILIVLIAGLFWSFGPLVVRYIDDAQLIPWQYLFFRGSVIFLVLNIYLFLAEGFKFTKNYYFIEHMAFIKITHFLKTKN